MSKIDTNELRELLRGVPYPGFSKDIVSAGFIGRIATSGRKVEVEFKPNTRDQAKISDMEEGIREVLLGADFAAVAIRRITSLATADAALRSAPIVVEKAPESGGCGCSSGESRLMTPLQAEMLEDGELPEADLLAIALGRHDMAQAAGYQPGGPRPLSGPSADLSFDCGIPVLQWDIDPHDPQAKTSQHEIDLGGWEYRVWWQAHPGAALLFVSMQAMREDWVEHEGASPHPVGRSEAVNLVYDEKRAAVVAIYGTVRDFRPFVKAFSQALALESNQQIGDASPEGVGQ
jgi:hypothetical protein